MSGHLAAGMEIAGCRIIEKIGEGGMGAVFRCRDENLERDVALKVMHPASDSETARRRFHQEAAAIARIDHPGIVRIYSFGETEGLPFFLMEFVPGRPLKTFITRVRTIHGGGSDLAELQAAGYLNADPSLPFFLRDSTVSPLQDPEYPRRVADLVGDLADALAAAHAEGIIHRDLKPSNILLTQAGRTKIVDFGLVKREGGMDLTRQNAGGFLGTLRYAAPEQLSTEAPVTVAADIFSLGIVFYELLSFRHPFGEENDDSRKVIAGILTRTPPSIDGSSPHISPTMIELLGRCLDKDPAKRPSGSELSRALRSIPSQTSSWMGGISRFFQRFVQTIVSGEPESKPVAPPPPTLPSPNRDGSHSPRPTEELLQRARKAFFGEFALQTAIEGFRKVLALDPENVDAVFPLALGLSSIGEHVAIREEIRRLPSSAGKRSDREERKLALVKALFLDRDLPRVEREAEACQSLFPDDPDFFWAGAYAAGMQEKDEEAISIGKEIEKRWPEALYASFHLSEAYEGSGRMDLAAEVLERTFRKAPQVRNLRMRMIGLLLFNGRLEESERHLNEVFQQNIHEDFGVMSLLKVRLHLFRGQKKDAIRVLRTVIGSVAGTALRGFATYVLYRLLAGAPESGKAASNALEQARALLPKGGFRSLEEARTYIEGFDFSGLLASVADRPWMPSVLKIAQEVCLASLEPEVYTHGNFGRLPCFVLSADGSWSSSLIFIQYSLETIDFLVGCFRLPGPPALPVIDSRGRILQAEIRKLPACSNGNGVKVTARLAESLPPGHAEFVLVDMEDQPPQKTGPHSWRLGAPGFLLTSARRHAVVLVIPKCWHVTSSSEEMVKVIPFPEGTMVVFERFLYAGSQFAPEVTLSRD